MTRKTVSTPDANRRRFIIVQSALIAAFAAAMFATGMALPRVEAPFYRWLFAAGPILLLVLWAWEFFRMIRADDEMMQVMHLRAVSLGAGLVLLAASLWDVAVRLLGVAPVPTFLLLPAFALLYCFALPIVMRRP